MFFCTDLIELQLCVHAEFYNSFDTVQFCNIWVRKLLGCSQLD